MYARVTVRYSLDDSRPIHADKVTFKVADASFGFLESVPFRKAGLGEGWKGPYFGYDTVDFMLGESLLAKW